MPKLSFVTWFCADVRSSVAFYGQLGIVFVEEQHGSGPIHFAFDADGLAIELYPAQDSSVPSGADMLIGFEVADADEVSSIAGAKGFDIVERMKTTTMGRRIVLRDPDGRRVLLFAPSMQTS